MIDEITGDQYVRFTTFAIVTGASTGIGLELAKRCAREGHELLIAADEPEIEQAAASLRVGNAVVEAVQADLATTEVGTSCMPLRRVAKSMPFWRRPVGASAMQRRTHPSETVLLSVGLNVERCRAVRSSAAGSLSPRGGWR
jgi:hypothetical protein